jgi:predicted nucleic acid-binding OB-fold protein
MAKKVSLETICIMDEIVEFTKDWDRMISERIVYPEIHNKINKYKSFVDFDRVKYKKVLIDLCG